MDYAIVEGVEDVEVSLGTNGRKKLAKKLGIEITEVNKLLYDKSLAKAPPNKTKEEIRAIDAAKAKAEAKKASDKKKTPKKPKAENPSYEEIKASLVKGSVDNSKVKRGTIDNPITEEIELPLARGEKGKVLATNYGSIAIHRPVLSPNEGGYKISEVATGFSAGENVYPKRQAEQIAKRLATLDWTNSGTVKSPRFPDDTMRQARSILGM